VSALGRTYEKGTVGQLQKKREFRCELEKNGKRKSGDNRRCTGEPEQGCGLRSAESRSGREMEGLRNRYAAT
jgi:hypothetical protein